MELGEEILWGRGRNPLYSEGETYFYLLIALSGNDLKSTFKGP